ncbi:putative multidrug resistance protein NorM (Na(+)/drug antiporter [Candidatus Gastranaerophilus sp. (ex Termes propinquus)]|nr:putative multidrug resistance protein NorM (Na(+)/drug antiporter [Candidatus Gastranaerophilus sp. (ex Termes propinquus)]
MRKHFRYFKELLTLSLPILAGNLGNVLIGTGSVIVAGKHSTVTLASISVATAILMTIMVCAIGLISSVSPVLSNIRGARKPTKTLFKATLAYAMVLAAVFFVLIRLATLCVPYIGLAPELNEPVVQFLNIGSFSIFGVCLYFSLKEFLQAYEIVVFANALSIIGIFVNFGLCFLLVFGFLAIPPMGIEGIAWSNLIVRVLEGIALLIYCIPFLKGKNRKYHLYLKELLKTGYPISLAVFAEFFGFNITAVLVGKFSSVYTAAHNVILTITAASYMIPFSISNAMAIKVGYANGERNLQDVKRYALAGTLLIFGVMFLTMFVYLFFTRQLMGIFTDDQAVIAVGVPLAVIVICFLFFDGLQCACAGALKGLKETRPIMYTMVGAFIFIGLPIGCVLAFRYNIVLQGFWIGLAVALFFASVVSSIFLLRKIRKLDY